MLLLVFLNIKANAQIKFEKGYVIDKNDVRIICFIKSLEPKNTPKSLRYKLSESSSDSKKLTLTDFKEFGIGEKVKYKKKAVKIDKSKSGPISNLSNKMNSEYISDTLLLKVLIDGKVSLYKYEEYNLIRFFYEKETEPIEQLDFKEYKTSKNKIGVNERYKQQLTLYFNCENLLNTDTVDYNERDLIKYFEDYYNCSGGGREVKYFRSKNKGSVKFGIKYEAMLASTKLIYNDNLQANFGNNLVNSYGLFVEFVMPFRKNKWSFFIEPSYQTFAEETEAVMDLFSGAISLKYSSIELPVGVRYYMFLTEDSRFYLNTAYLIDLFSKTNAMYINNEFIDSNEVLGNLSFGLGYSFKRFSLEYRHKRKKNLAGNSAGWLAHHKGNSLILRLSILK